MFSPFLCYLPIARGRQQALAVSLEPGLDYNTKRHPARPFRSSVRLPFSIIKAKLGRTSKCIKPYKVLKPSFILHFEVRFEVLLREPQKVQKCYQKSMKNRGQKKKGFDDQISSILDRFWAHFGVKTGQKAVPERDRFLR